MTIVSQEFAAYIYLVSTTVIGLKNEKCHHYSPYNPSDIRKELVDFIEASIVNGAFTGLSDANAGILVVNDRKIPRKHHFRDLNS